MARPGGLGPQGRSAIRRAAQENTAAPVVDPTAAQVDHPTTPSPVSSPLSERETLPRDWVQFQSSRIASAGYDEASGRLYVLFHKPFPEGTAWTYDGIQPNVWRNLQRTQSAGKFVNTSLNPITHGHPGQWG